MAIERTANLRNAQYHRNIKKIAGRTGLNQRKVLDVQKYGYAKREAIHHVPRNIDTLEKIRAGTERL